MMSTPSSHNGRARFLFGFILLAQLAVTAYLLITHRLCREHDGLLHFLIQYYFANNVATAQEVPQWIPTVAHGTTQTVWYISQAGFFQSAFLFLNGLLKRLNFFVIFNLNILVDQLLLLAGTWCLARRLFSSVVTAFFVTVTVMGSCIWITQPGFNFHFYYTIPVMLYFGHRFLDTGFWRYFFLSGNLLASQSIVDSPYSLPVVSLVVFLYFLGYGIFNFQETTTQLKKLRLSWPAVLSFLGVVGSFLVVYLIIKFDTEQVVFHKYGRGADGEVSEWLFLNYGTVNNLNRWLELFLGISPAYDYTLFIGYLPLALLFPAFICNRSKTFYHLLSLIIILLLFSLGTFVSIFFYHVWPFMKVYRHLSLCAPIIKLFLCFLAGIGFETVFLHKKKEQKDIAGALKASSLFMFGLFGAAWALFLFVGKMDLNRLLDFILSIRLPCLGTSYFTDAFFKYRLTISMIYIFLTFIFLIILSVKKTGGLVFWRNCALLLHVVNIYHYMGLEINLRTDPIPQQEYHLTSFQSLPFSKQRNAEAMVRDPRSPDFFYIRQRYPHPFLFGCERCVNFRADFWQKPLDEYLNAYKNAEEKFAASETLAFPPAHPGALKISGVLEETVQFFTGASVGPNDQSVAEKIADINYRGDVLFLSKPAELNSADFQTLEHDANVRAQRRITLPYTIGEFSSNHLHVEVDAGTREGVWMLYSDVWHPDWRATINGETARIFKTNLAYKAVYLKPGVNKIHFYFKRPLLTLLYYLIALNGLFWTGWILRTTGQLARGKT